jgi:hypothetical protein
MKRIPFQGSLWWRLTLLYTILLGVNSILVSDNQYFKCILVQKQIFSTIVDKWLLRSYHIDDAQEKFVYFSAASGVNNSSISNDISTINSLNRSFLKPLKADKSSTFPEKFNLSLGSVVFDFVTSGKSSQSFQCTLLIDSSFSSSFMPCCDQLYIGSKLDPQVSIKKNSSSMSVAHYPKSSFYEIFAVGQGIVTASGSPGYFFVPPNIYFGHIPLQLLGPGPHKIYWLEADHIDETGHLQEWLDSSSVSIGETHYPYFQEGIGSGYDFLGRTSSEKGAFKIMRIDGKWVKVVTVK